MLGEKKTRKDSCCFGLFIVSYSSGCVQYVDGDGSVNYNNCNWNNKAVRPFWDGRRNKVRETLKLESHHQKNKQPFLHRKNQDKYKGMKFYDRR